MMNRIEKLKKHIDLIYTDETYYHKRELYLHLGMKLFNLQLIDTLHVVMIFVQSY